MEQPDKEQLLVDLYRAYKEARRHKRSRYYQLRFEYNLESNLIELRDELRNQTYVPRPSTCFIITDPKMREVFAADFRDRIVHHLFYNYTYRLFEPTFIQDSYSCLKGRGTHYGIRRLRHHIRSESRNYRRPCYVMKLDIRGYFMHIRRKKLREICRDTLHKSGCQYLGFLYYLLDIILCADPLKDCIVLGDRDAWQFLPKDKSLFTAAKDCGLPIGNLSSQLFSNVYMNVFDQYCKRVLKCRHYGRYVDDIFIVSSDYHRLLTLRVPIGVFLQQELGLALNPDKIRIVDVRQGVEFLGAFLKPYRTYPASASLRRMKRKVLGLRPTVGDTLRPAVNSYLGVLGHYATYRLRRVLFGSMAELSRYGRFSGDGLRFYPHSSEIFPF